MPTKIVQCSDITILVSASAYTFFHKLNLNMTSPTLSPRPLFEAGKAFLMAQMVKNLPAMKATRVQSLGQEDPLEEGMATHSSILAWRIPMDRGA